VLVVGVIVLSPTFLLLFRFRKMKIRAIKKTPQNALLSFDSKLLNTEHVELHSSHNSQTNQED